MNKKIFAANWKMYLNSNESREFMLKINANKDLFSEFDIMIFPSHVAISIIQDLAKGFDNIKIGMQDCDILTSGAVTGSNSITSHKVDSCIVGHSERRTIFNENDEENKTFEVIKKQLSILPHQIQGKNLDIAYEPVWAIGTGLVASKQHIEDVLSYINILIKELYSVEDRPNIRLFYGGSVDENSVEELSSISLLDGFLIGSASADFDKFKNMLNKMR